jgi:hypothetical protein
MYVVFLSIWSCNTPLKILFSYTPKLLFYLNISQSCRVSIACSYVDRCVGYLIPKEMAECKKDLYLTVATK